MNVADLLGAPVTDHPELEARLASPCRPPIPIETNPTPPKSRRMLASALALGGLTLGAAIGWFSHSGPAVVETVAANPSPVEQSRQVGGVAELFTSLYLSGVTPPNGLTTVDPPLASGGIWVSQTATVGISARSDGLWEVLVAVDSLELIDDKYEPIELQYFSVTVSDATDRPVVVAPPARVPPPAATIEGLAPNFPDTVPPDQRAAITEFLNGYLTGTQDVARYMTPTARIRLFPEPPYSSISVQEFGANELGQVSVSLTAHTEGGASHSLSYAVDTAFTSGVWEVANIFSGQVSR